jgi:transcriptional regulator with XRE-family HTH domain
LDKTVLLNLKNENNMEKTLIIGKKIRIARLLRGYSQENIANELGIKQQTYHLLENGVINFTKRRIENVCKVLKLDMLFIEALDDIDLLNNIVCEYLKSKKVSY